MRLNHDILEEIRRRGITRLCHFTPSNNLPHILGNSEGLRDRQSLLRDAPVVANLTDPNRLDGHPELISCTVEYPNPFYLRVARQRELLFQDWVVLFISPHHLARPGVLFAPHNAASGCPATPGLDGFRALFETAVPGGRGTTLTRYLYQPDYLPTSLQAEVLLPPPVPVADILAIAVQDEEQCKREAGRLEMLGLTVPRIVVCGELFDLEALRAIQRTGQRPREKFCSGRR